MDLLLYGLLFEFIGRSIARFAIPALSFGRAYVLPRNAPSERFDWLGFRQDDDGRIVVARDVAGFIGFMIVVILLTVLLLAVRPCWTPV